MKFKFNYLLYLARLLFFFISKKNIVWKSFKVGFGKNVRIRCLDKGKIFFGKNNFFDDNCCIEAIGNGKIIFGDNVKLNRNITLVARKEIIISDNVIFGPNSIIYDHDYNFSSLVKKNKKYISKEIFIEKNCWIGGLSFIGKGVRVGKNSVIAAGSKVTKNVNKNVIFKNKI